MIRLRSGIARAVQHPVLGPLAVALLVLLLAFVCLHIVEDQLEGAGAVCIAFALLVAVLPVARLRPPAVHTRVSPSLRASPPSSGGRTSVTRLVPLPLPVSLRL